MHTTYTICFKSYKDKIAEFNNGFFCVPRALAIKAWGGKDKLVRCIENGTCCLKKLGGIDFVEWKVCAQELMHRNNGCVPVCTHVRENACKPDRIREYQYERVIAAMFDEAKHDWKSVGCSEIEENGILVGELHRRLSKAAEAMEKACRWSEKSFRRLRAMDDAGTLSSEGTEAMRTLFVKIKARLHRAHRYIICYTTHTDVTSIFL